MAINPGTLYTGKINAPDANYTYGSARNITVSGDGTGTPWVASIINDRFGVNQRLLVEAGIVPSGNPETVLTSQYFDAMAAIFGQTKDTIAACDTDSKIVVGSYIRTRSYLAGKNRGSALYKVVAAATGTDDGGSFIDLTASGHQLQLIPEKAWVSPYQWGAVGDKSVDDATALANCYTYAKNSSPKRWMYLESGAFKIQSGLTWDGEIDVKGEGNEKTIIHKDGNFVGITLTLSNNEVGNFQLTSLSGTAIGGTDTANGINVVYGANSQFHGITVTYQGNHGIEVNMFTSCVGYNWQTRHNGADGVKWSATGGAFNNNASSLIQVDTLGNADNGFTIDSGDNDYSIFDMITCQQNGKHGFYCNGNGNICRVYGEVNDQDGGGAGAGTYRDIYLDSSSVRNQITVISATSSAGIYDEGTNNFVYNSGTAATIAVPQINPRQREANALGRNLSIAAGQAGSGASPFAGGALFLAGGEADGTGNARGGHTYIRGGAPIGTGAPGNVYIQENDGVTVVGSTSGTSDYALLDLTSTTKALILTRMTTTQRNAMTGVNGMLIYNTTDNKFQGYENSSWVNLI